MSCCAAVVASPEYLKDASYRSEQIEQDRIIASSTDLGGDKYKTDFIVPDMHCAGCIGAIERGLSSLDLIEHVRVNLSLKTVSVVWNRGKGNVVTVSRKLDALGFPHHLSDEIDGGDSQDKKGRKLLLSLAVSGFAAANIMLLSVSVWSGASSEIAQLFHLLSGLIAVPAIAFAGQPFFKSALNALSAKRLNMDVPISLAVLLALGMSLYESVTGGEEAYFDAGVTLLFFLLIGRYLDHLMRQKARSAVERLSSISAKNGLVVQPDGKLGHIELKDIKAGMTLRVFAGERFPVNGTIISGATDLDCSHVTGESDSIFANDGMEVEAGTLNLTSPVDILATSTAETSFLAEMRKMMEAAEKGRGIYTGIADRMAQIYAPAVHILALITFIGWMVITGGDWHTSIYVAIAVLIVTCPCALGLAVPVAHVIGANKLLQNGIMMREGAALERMAQVTAVVFDKTGTLTKGQPSVTKSHGEPGATLPMLKAMCSTSSHPIAKAIDASIETVTARSADEVTEVPGCGVQASFNGKIARLGKPAWVAEISRQETIPNHIAASFAFDGEPPLHFEIEDELRLDARSSIETLKQRGLDLEILSGDNLEKVRKLAGNVGIECYHASNKPEEKIARIKEIQSDGDKVLMVGDGINDAPALALGHVSMVPASASDVGRHAADFVFIGESLSAVPIAFDIAKLTDRIVRQNFGLAIAYNCIAVPLAMGGYITPMLAAIAMSASSIVVIANSFRINLPRRSSKPITADFAANHKELELPA